MLTFQFGDPVTEKEVTAGLIRRPEYLEHPELVRVRQGFSLLDMRRYWPPVAIEESATAIWK